MVLGSDKALKRWPLLLLHVLLLLLNDGAGFVEECGRHSVCITDVVAVHC